MVCVMRKVTNSKSLENVLFLLLLFEYRVCHFIDDGLKKKLSSFYF